MKTQQLIASLTFSVLLLFPRIARADNIDIRTSRSRVTISPSGDIVINTQQTSPSSTSNQLRTPINTRPSSTRVDLSTPRSICNGTNDHYQRTDTSSSGRGRIYTHSSTVTRVCR